MRTQKKAMPRLPITFALAAFALFSGCGPMADMDNPKSYQTGGLSFQYPGNWKVQAVPISDEFRSINIETPKNGIVVIQTYPLDSANTLKEYVQAFAESSNVSIPFGEIANSTLTEEDTWEDYTWISEKFEITVLGETVPHYRLYRSKDVNGKRIFMILQSSFYDAAGLVPGFDLIAGSLEFPKDDAGHTPG